MAEDGADGERARERRVNEKRGDDDWKSILSCLSLTGYLGFLMAASIFAGFAAGWGLDWLLGTRAFFRIVCMIMGIAGGFLNVYKEIARRLG